jgi:phosphate-selective porin OprO/OprP
VKLLKKLSIVVALAAIIPAYADEYKDTLSILREKGILTQKEYDDKLKAYEEKEENKKFAERRIDKDVSDSVKYRQARANDGSVSENGLGLKSKDGNNTAQFTGRVHMDYRHYTPNYGVSQTTDSYQNVAELRRARFGVRGQFAKDFKYELVGNFGNDVGAASSVTNMDVAWVNYAANPEMQFQFGLFKMPFSLEQLQSSNNIDMMERSLIGQVEGEFIPSKETGFMIHGVPTTGLTYAVAASRGRGNKDAVADGFDYIGRVTTNIAELTGSKAYVAHLGAAYSTGEIKGGVATASGRTESRTQSAWYTGPALTGLTTRTRLGLEAAAAYNAFKVQSEMFEFNYDPTVGTDQKIKGYYVLATYNITGESYNYKDGVFGAVKPTNPLDKGGRGAWQVGVRMSEFDASPIIVAAGKSNRATAMTYGLTWFATDNLRFMVNYVDTKFDQLVGASGSRVKGDQAIMFRSQLNF